MGPARTRLRAAFAAGCLAVTVGVCLHLPMLWMARGMGFRLVGMATDGAMIAGMALIVAGIALAAYGLLPDRAADAVAIAAHVPDDAPLSAAHWRLMAALIVALVIDVMKPASLGFTLPGMEAEYGLPKHVVALLPFSALTGTVLGSMLWGALADRYGRRSTIMLSAVMFVGTSICGAMPSFSWNLAMCLLMGLAAGGMLPVTYALLAEMMPARHRGWSMVLVGGLGAAGGYAAASLISALAQPLLGWRVLWLANLPTGLLLISLGPLIPESARFLAAHGRLHEAGGVLARFGAVLAPVAEAPPPTKTVNRTWLFAALTLIALAWGWANFGVLLWLPADLVARGLPVAEASALLARSAVIAVPTTGIAALLYYRWGARPTLTLAIAVMLTGMALLVIQTRAAASPVLSVAVLLVGVNAIIAVILPYTAETFALAVRGRATGWIAACTKAGGLGAQALGLASLVLGAITATWVLVIPTVLALGLLLVSSRADARMAKETS
ncbi:MFS transporter [Parablastomonas sp. CN1-191]|uniref:MFS transporter n=1 Tax=Parablastomonas sp. CN1-191 TaxID=3400908 RepID=UPI003BF87983